MNFVELRVDHVELGSTRFFFFFGVVGAQGLASV